jgi:flavin-dependent dehydrogenase
MIMRGWNRLAAPERELSSPRLTNGSRVGVIGGGPAGSFFSYFLLRLAKRADLQIKVDIYEPRDFSQPAPRGCNMCGGIVSESLVQTLATEGINLPQEVVVRGIDSYTLHMDVGSVRIDTPLHEMRIAAVYRGSGPSDIRSSKTVSFDWYLQKLAGEMGANILRQRVSRVTFANGQPQIFTDNEAPKAYELVAVGAGVNSFAPKLLRTLGPDYRPPETTKTLIREYYLGREKVREHIGSSMHIFLLNLPRVEFAAIIPKEDYVTVCLLGEDIDRELVKSFFNAPEVKSRFPDDWVPETRACQCRPRINVRRARLPFGDRIVFLGDCGVTRLYKDGIGGAYRAAKAAAATAVLQGISVESFRRHYGPHCRSVAADNAVGKLTFAFTRIIQKYCPARRALWKMTLSEQQKEGRQRRMSQVMWDLFTGSASYRNVFLRMLHPAFLSGFLRNLFTSAPSPAEVRARKDFDLEAGMLGKIYQDGEAIVRQGEVGDCVYVILSGQVEVTVKKDGEEVALRFLNQGDFFGEMALFDREVRSATVRALGRARVLTVDKNGLLRRVQEDPSLAFRIIEQMSGRIRQLTSEVARLKSKTKV